MTYADLSYAVDSHTKSPSALRFLQMHAVVNEAIKQLSTPAPENPNLLYPRTAEIDPPRIIKILYTV